MNYKQLFFLVEGNDDELFFQRIVSPIFEGKYNQVTVWKYAQVKNTGVYDFIKSIKAMGAEYIYVVDVNLSPCVTDKKRRIQDKFNNIDTDRIIVVIKEIESWYLAGLDTLSSKKLKISPLENTNNVTKEQFHHLIPKRFDSKIDFMLEILRLFSIKIAKQKNKSFRYLLEKYNCKV